MEPADPLAAQRTPPWSPFATKEPDNARSQATWLAFAAFSGLRTVSYLPQIARIARDRNGASAISYPTWLLWTGANATTALYAATNLNDLWLAFGSSIYALCCIVVIVLTAFKRLAHRRTKEISSRNNANERAWGGHLQWA